MFNLECLICGDEFLDIYMLDEEFLDFESVFYLLSIIYFEYYWVIYYYIYEFYFCILLGCISRYWGFYILSNEVL